MLTGLLTRMKSLFTTLIATALAVVLTCAVAGFLSLPQGRALEAWMGDHMLTWRYELTRRLDPNQKPDARLVLAAVDAQSVNDLGHWPFPRAIHGQFFQLLAPEKPRVVALDAFFPDTAASSPAPAPALPVASTNDSAPPAVLPPLPPDDQALVDGIKLLPSVVIAAEGDSLNGSTLQNANLLPTQPLPNIVGDATRILSYPLAQIPFLDLREITTFGFAEAGTKEEVRTLPLVVKIGAQVFPSFDLQVLMQYNGVDAANVVVDLGHAITLRAPGDVMIDIPIDDAGNFLINYRGRAGDFHTVGYSAMEKGLGDKAGGRTSPESAHVPLLQDKIVVVGVMLPGIDDGPTPIDPSSPLVIAHLNLLDNVLHGDYLHEADAGFWLLLYGLFLFGLAGWMLRISVAAMIPLVLTAMILLADLSFGALWFGNTLMPVLAPELGVVFLAGLMPMRRNLNLVPIPSVTPVRAAAGPATDLAARIDALARQLGAPIFLSENAAKWLGADLPMKDLGPVKIEGCAEPVRLYAIGMGEETPAETIRATTVTAQPPPIPGAKEKRPPMWRIAPGTEDEKSG